MDKATQKSIEWQKANYPMVIGGDAFTDIVDSFNVNPAFVAGYKEAQKDLALTWEDMKDVIAAEGSIYDENNGNSKEVFAAYPTEEAFYGEVLRRFNEQRKK